LALVAVRVELQTDAVIMSEVEGSAVALPILHSIARRRRPKSANPLIHSAPTFRGFIHVVIASLGFEQRFFFNQVFGL
jgi:hypothetical protein